MKVIHYPRVSSKKQVEQGDSIEFQEERLKKHSEENGDECVEVITDAGKSASLSDDKLDISYSDGKLKVIIDVSKRPGMCKILEEVKENKWEAVKITKWDRFSRNNIFSKLVQLYFKKYGKKIIPTDDSVDPLMMEIKGALSEEEIRKLKGRIRDVRLLRFEKGMMVARPPIGYKFNKAKKTIEVDPHKSKIVKKVFEMAYNGSSYKDICKETKLKPQQVYNIIRNKVYTGIIQFEGMEKQGNHEPLVSKEVWEKCQEIFNKK